MSTINTNYSSGMTAYEATKNTKANTKAEDAAKETESTAKEDSFVKSPQYKMDTDKVNSMKADLNKNIAAFKSMVQGMVQKQGGVANNAMNILLDIDKATQLSAQQAISEDGEWGVEQTAKRMLDFAKALSGGDPSKIEALRGAFQKGFEAAEKVWGGKLPDISYQTYDRVMQGFDEWANGGSAE